MAKLWLDKILVERNNVHCLESLEEQAHTVAQEFRQGKKLLCLLFGLDRDPICSQQINSLRSPKAWGQEKHPDAWRQPILAALLTAEFRQGHLEKWMAHSLKLQVAALGSYFHKVLQRLVAFMLAWGKDAWRQPILAALLRAEFLQRHPEKWTENSLKLHLGH